METAVKRAWQIRLAALAIFVLGFAAGALALNVYSNAAGARGGDSGRRHFEQMLDSLDLTAEQRERVHAILGDARSQMADVRKECGPKFREVRERTDARMREVLTPAQWEKFDAEMRSARDHHHHGSSEGSGVSDGSDASPGGAPGAAAPADGAP